MQLARMLMDAKADAAVEGHGGYAALQQAAKMGHPDMVCLLLEEGVEVNMADSQGWTALHVAAMLGHKDWVIVEHHSDVLYEYLNPVRNKNDDS